MHPVIFLITTVISTLSFLLLVYVIMTLLVQFDILNRRQQLVALITNALGQLFEPMLRWIRGYLPMTGGLDLSPLVLFIGLEFLRYTIVYYA